MPGLDPARRRTPPKPPAGRKGGFQGSARHSQLDLCCWPSGLALTLVTSGEVPCWR